MPKGSKYHWDPVSKTLIPAVLEQEESSVQQQQQPQIDKPLYHWDPDLQTLVPIPEGETRRKQPPLTETTFTLIRALYERYGTARAVYLTTSYSEGLVYDVLKVQDFAAFRKAREAAQDARTARDQQQRQQASLAQAERALSAMPDAAELVEVTSEDVTPLQTDALERIINALEGIDTSLKAIREDTRQSLELTRQLYDIWKPMPSED